LSTFSSTGCAFEPIDPAPKPSRENRGDDDDLNFRAVASRHTACTTGYFDSREIHPAAGVLHTEMT
jgi:hypothetical protein